MTAPKWLPSDDELDGLARTLEPTTLGTDEAEHQRTSLLASAAGVPQQSPSNRAPLFVALGAVLAAAAAVVLWIGLRTSDETKSTANVIGIGEASFERLESWPTYSVRVDEGRVRIDVVVVQRERFIARTSDAELEINRATLEMSVAKGRLDAIEVSAGRAELRLSGEPSIFVSAGESWRSTRTADVLTPPPTPDIATPSTPDIATDSATNPVTQRAEPHAKRTPKTARVDTSRTGAPDAAPMPGRPETTTQAPTPVPPTGPNPGELEFRAGMAALRSGDAAAAVTSFAAACNSARGDALAEDACFWVGAAANRAGQASIAREALTRFVQKFASSARVGEASALLGWLLYEAGDLDGAEARFRRAASDRVPKVKASADKGLEAIKRRRATP